MMDDDKDIELICVRDKHEKNDKVEYIEIDDSDSENPFTEECSPKETQAKSSIIEEKIDYLHLNSSDSEDDQPNINKNVDDLLNTAAVLSDASCGPQKNSQTTSFTKEEIPFLSSNLTRESPNLSKALISNELDDDIMVVDGEKVVTSVKVDSSSKEYMYRTKKRTFYVKGIVNFIPNGVHKTYSGHTRYITSLNWCIPKYSHLFSSASLDGTLKVWDVEQRDAVQSLELGFPLKAAQWLISGEQVVVGGCSKKAYVYDILSGLEAVNYDMYNIVTSIAIHPFLEDVFLCGTKNAILGFDLRVNTKLPIRTFLSECGDVLDIAFADENEFICSTSIVSKDSADRTIMVWDFNTGAIMSNQIYLERYTCPSLKVHPHDSSFVAQSTGDYIACFSSKRPYKIMNKRYMGHKVSFHDIECDISPDGKYLATGDADGDVYFYNYRSTSLLQKKMIRPTLATNKIKWHPIYSKTLLVSTWDGQIHILK